MDVRRHYGGDRKEPTDERVDGVVEQQLRPALSDHHRIDHQGHGVAGEMVGNDLVFRSATTAPTVKIDRMTVAGA